MIFILLAIFQLVLPLHNTSVTLEESEVMRFFDANETHIIFGGLKKSYLMEVSTKGSASWLNPIGNDGYQVDAIKYPKFKQGNNASAFLLKEKVLIPNEMNEKFNAIFWLKNQQWEKSKDFYSTKFKTLVHDKTVTVGRDFYNGNLHVMDNLKVKSYVPDYPRIRSEMALYDVNYFSFIMYPRFSINYPYYVEFASNQNLIVVHDIENESLNIVTFLEKNPNENVTKPNFSTFAAVVDAETKHLYMVHKSSKDATEFTGYEQHQVYVYDFEGKKKGMVELEHRVYNMATKNDKLHFLVLPGKSKDDSDNIYHYASVPLSTIRKAIRKQ